MIDVLLPFYGEPALLKVAVRSVLDQRNAHWRLVVVDDCHPDISVGEWIRSLGDHRVEYHRNASNLGANRNYREALNYLEADHFVMMGADDAMDPSYLDVISRTISEAPSAGVITCHVNVIDESGRQYLPLTDRIKRALTPRGQSVVELQGESAIISLLRGNWTYFPALCWRRDLAVAANFREKFNVVQDLGLLIDVLRAGAPLALAPEHAFNYRRHSGSDSAVKTAAGGMRFLEERDYFAAIARELDAEGRPRAARAARWHVTSRLHAAALMIGAARAHDRGDVQALWKHVTARSS